MKKRTVEIKWITLGVILLMTGLCFSACTDPAAQKKLEIESMEQEDFALDMNEGESSTCTYSDQEKTVFSIGKRNDAATGPLVNTERLLVFSKDGVQEIPVNDEAYIYNAVPFKNGVLYASYKYGDPGECEWSVNYAEKERIELIDSGQCESYGNMPSIVYIGDIPYYQFTEKTSQGIREGIKRVVNGDPELVVSYECSSMQDPLLRSNGTEYCYIMADGSDPTYIIGDESGVLYKNTIRKKMVDFGINDNTVVCSLAEDVDGKAEYEMLAIDLHTGEENYHEAKQPYYRICGSGDAFLCVDFQFGLHLINAKGGSIVPEAAEYPESPDLNKRSVFFYSQQEGRFLVNFFKDDDHEEAYYEIVVN